MKNSSASKLNIRSKSKEKRRKPRDWSAEEIVSWKDMVLIWVTWNEMSNSTRST